MKKTSFVCLGFVAILLISTVRAESETATLCDTPCNPCDELSCEPCEPCIFDGCGPEKSRWVFGGHLEAGLYTNEYGQKNQYGDYGFNGNYGNTDYLKNVRQSDFQMNQLHLYFGKELDTRRGWDFGGRVDVMYGTDARLVQSRGLETGAGHGTWNSGDYYTALAQMYFEAGYKDVTIKFGKFLTPMGHEGVLSNDRFFYSLSDAFGLQSQTHSGVLVDWKVNRKLSVFGGWVNGENKFFDSSDDNAFLGGVRYRYNNRISFGYTLLAGTEDLGYDDRDYFVHTFITDIKLGKRWDYTFEWTLRNETIELQNDNNGGYGINQELVYKLNKEWSLGLRGEWLHTYVPNWHDGKFNVTFAANWTPTKWLTVRPEIRYDRFEHGRNFNWAQTDRGTDHDRKDQFAGGISAYVTF